MALTLHQVETKEQVIAALNSGAKRIKLVGSAGVGKTFLVSDLVEYFLATMPTWKPVFVTAPTNKALAVLISKIKTDAPNLLFRTIHQAVSLKRHINSRTGVVTFEKDKWARVDPKDNFNRANICIVDETSMLNSQFVGGTIKLGDGTEQTIEGYLEEYHFPIIFVGDYKQLNPVGEPVSPIWLKPFPQFELTEIIRQGAGNPIIDLSRDIDLLYFKEQHIIEGKGYKFSNNKYGIISKLAEVNGTDDMKYLSWTNVDVDEVNKLVREDRYGTPARLELGETIVFNSPLGEFYTNKEVRIDELAIFTSDISLPTFKTRVSFDGSLTGPVDKIRLKYYKVNGSFDVIHEDSDNIFREICNNLKLNCTKFGWNWKCYYWFIERFADIKYNHAISIHKSLETGSYKTHLIDWKLLRA